MQKLLTTALLVGATALTAACGSAAASDRDRSRSAPTQPTVAADGIQRVTLNVANRMAFEPSTIGVRAGQPVELTLRNGGNIRHDFTLSEGLPRPVTIEADGGETARATFTIDRPGTYTFICSVGGHEKAGMKGSITAQ